jgi:YgiT-type zinc finger domain-containing protein
MAKSPRNSSLTCKICGEKAARVRRIARTYGSGARPLVIENVPVVSCTACGESYLTAEVLLEIERIKRDRRVLAKSRRVAVAAMR